MAASTSDRTPFQLKPLTPHRQQLSWFHPAGWVLISVTNTGDVDARCRLEATDQTCACRFQFTVPTMGLAGAQLPTLRLAAGETIEIAVRVVPPERSLVGLRPRRYDCALTLTPSSEPGYHQAILAQLSWSPLFGPPGGVAGMLLLCMLLLVWGPGLPPYGSDELGLPQARSQPTSTMLPPLAQNVGGQSTRLTPPLDPQTTTSAPSLSPYDAFFQVAAQQHQFDWQMLARLAYLESHFNAKAVGLEGELGLMQIHPSTWQIWAPQVGVTDPFDPQSNILVGTTYLAHIRDHLIGEGYGESKWMLVAYNWGPENLQQALNSGDGWDEVPVKSRQYALEISQNPLFATAPASTFSKWRSTAQNCPLSDLPLGLHLSASGSYTQTQTEAAGSPTCRIERDTCAYYRLVGDLDPTLIFKREEEPPFDEEDIKMHPAALLPLSRLNALVQQEWGGLYQLRITDAYDSLLEHDLGQPDNSRRASLHFEGRALDLTTWPIKPELYGRLCMLAHCAGFDWVHNEGDHCHAAIRAESLCTQCGY